MSELDYTLEYAEEGFFVTHNEGNASILDSNGDHIVTIFNYNLWPFGTALPKIMAQMLLSGYNQGYKEGKQDGYRDAQYDMRRVLGL